MSDSSAAIASVAKTIREHWDRAIEMEKQNEIVGALWYYGMAMSALVCLKELTGETELGSCPADSCRLVDTIDLVSGRIDALRNAYCDHRKEILGGAAGPAIGSAGKAKSCDHMNDIEIEYISGEKGCQVWFDTIIGAEKAKTALVDGFIEPIIKPNLFKKRSNAVLFYGPPGTGKTELARAAANELALRSDSVEVRFFSPPASAMKSKYVGEGEERIHEIFKCASCQACAAEKAAAEEGRTVQVLSVLFLDEVEVLAGNRDLDKSGTGGASLNTLLQEMDGIASYPNVVVIAATNYPWRLDTAFLRRFQSRIPVMLPTAKDIFQFMNQLISNYVSTYNVAESKCGGIKGCPAGSTRAAPAPAPDAGAAPAPERGCKGSDRSAAAKAAANRSRFREGYAGRIITQKRLPSSRMMALASQMEHLGYSMSDVSAMFSNVSRQLGREAVEHGKYAEVSGAPIEGAPDKIYMSTLCGNPTNGPLRMVERPVEQHKGKPVYGIKINDAKYWHANYSPVPLPRGDAMIKAIYWREDGTDFEIVIHAPVRIVKQAEKKWFSYFRGTAVYESEGDALKMALESVPYGATWPEMWELVKGGSIDRTLMEKTMDEFRPPGEATCNLYFRVKLTRDVVESLNVGGVSSSDATAGFAIRAILSATNQVDVLTDWGQQTQHLRMVTLKDEEVVVVTQREFAAADSVMLTMQHPVSSNLSGTSLWKAPLSIGVSLDTIPSDPTHLSHILIVAKEGMPVSDHTTIPDTDYGAMMNWNFTPTHFEIAIKETPSSNDPDMTAALERYAVDNQAELKCQLGEDRSKRDAECANQFKKKHKMVAHEMLLPD